MAVEPSIIGAINTHWVSVENSVCDDRRSPQTQPPSVRRYALGPSLRTFQLNLKSLLLLLLLHLPPPSPSPVTEQENFIINLSKRGNTKTPSAHVSAAWPTRPLALNLEGFGARGGNFQAANDETLKLRSN